MQRKHVILAAAMVLVFMLLGITYAQTEDSVIRDIAEATYDAGANEAPTAAIEEAKKLAVRSFVEKIVGGYVIRRAQVQNTHLMASYVDFWSGAHVRVDSVLASRYWTDGESGGMAYRAYFSGRVSITASEIERFKGVIADIEQEVVTKLREETLAAKRMPRQEDSAPISRFNPSELRVELERRAILARITAEKLRLESMAAEEERQSQEAQARQAREEQITREKQGVAKRLAALQDSVAIMRSKVQAPASSLVSPLAALREMRRIDAQIKEIKSRYRGEFQRAILMVSQSVNPRFQAAASVRKSEFETDAEFHSRVAKMQRTAEAEQTRRFSQERARIESAYEENIAPFIAALKRLSSQQFRITWQDLQLNLGTYNPQFDIYPISIRVKQPLDSLAIFCSAQVPISRGEAQVLREHYGHDILRPELVGNFQTTQFFRVVAVYVIDDATNKQYNLIAMSSIMDDATNKQYNLFSSKFVNLGNGIVYDSVTSLLWLMDVYYFKREIESRDAERECKNLVVAGLSGWKLPTVDNLSRMFTACYNQEPHPFVNLVKGDQIFAKNNDDVYFWVQFYDNRMSSYRLDLSFNVSQNRHDMIVWPVRGGD